MISASKKPFLFVGGGAAIAGADQEVRSWRQRSRRRSADSLMGKGTFPGTDETYTGMLGMHGTKASNLGMYACDLVIVLGARFSDRDVGDTKHFANQAKILQIDVDPAENKQECAGGRGDHRRRKGSPAPASAHAAEEKHPEWLQEMEALKEKYPMDLSPGGLKRPRHRGRRSTGGRRAMR